MDYAAYTLEVLGFVALVVLLAWLVTFLSRQAPVAAGVTGIAGAAMLAVKVGSAAPMMAMYGNPDAPPRLSRR